MPFAFRASTTLLLSCLYLSVLAGCSRQKEGERCSTDNGDSDCAEDLLCTEAETLRNDDGISRCCPDPEDTPSDSRCALNTSVGAGTGGGPDLGEGGGGGEVSVDPPKNMDDACNWTSECDPPLVCGPQGTCQFECQEDVDCDHDETCSSEQVCVPN